MPGSVLWKYNSRMEQDPASRVASTETFKTVSGHPCVKTHCSRVTEHISASFLATFLSMLHVIMSASYNSSLQYLLGPSEDKLIV